MGKGLYVGKAVDPDKGTLGAQLELDPADLLTHGLIVGMTGSGKTGLAIVLLEELLRQGVPVIAIDPKGDLANLLLLFENLAPSDFEPWIDAGAARREGKDVKTAAADAAAAWKKGLAEWGLGPAEIAALEKSHDAVVYTPGSSAGVPLNVLQSLEAPAGSFAEVEEDLRDEIQSIVTGLLTLVGIEADPLQSPPAVFLASLVEHGWRAGKGFSLETLIGAVADPPFDEDRRPAARDGVPAQGPAEADDGAQHAAWPRRPSRRGGRASRSTSRACSGRPSGRACRSSRPRTSPTPSGCSSRRCCSTR